MKLAAQLQLSSSSLQPFEGDTHDVVADLACDLGRDVMVAWLERHDLAGTGPMLAATSITRSNSPLARLKQADAKIGMILHAFSIRLTSIEHVHARQGTAR